MSDERAREVAANEFGRWAVLTWSTGPGRWRWKLFRKFEERGRVVVVAVHEGIYEQSCRARAYQAAERIYEGEMRLLRAARVASVRASEAAARAERRRKRRTKRKPVAGG